MTSSTSNQDGFHDNTSKRHSGKEQVSLNWKTRADQQRKHQQPQSQQHDPNNNNKGGETLTICRTWRNVQDSISNVLLRRGGNPKQESDSQRRPSSNQTYASTTKTATTTRGRSRLEASLAERQRVAAIAAEVEDMHRVQSINYTTTMTPVDQILPPSCDDTKEPPPSGNHVSILPGNTDFSNAISKISQSQTSAFLLLDLASIVGSHRMFHSYTSPVGVYNRTRSVMEMRRRSVQQNGVFLEPQFTVGYNRDEQLLRLLIRLGVGLRCGGNGDVLASREALRRERLVTEENDNDDGKNMLVVDDASRSRKPDGFLRTLLFGGNDEDEDENDGCVREIAVDGPGEVHRVASCVRRFALRARNRRRGGVVKDGIKCHFMLTLKPYPFSNQSASPSPSPLTCCPWEKLILSVHEAAILEQQTTQGANNHDDGRTGNLVGVNVDLSTCHFEAECDDADNVGESQLRQICIKLRRIRMRFVSFGQTQMRMDFKGLPYPLTRERASALTNALSKMVSQDFTLDEFTKAGIHLDERAKKIVMNSASTVTFTVDISYHLVAHAGALCTRIIGVKRVPKKNTTHDEITKEPSPSSMGLNYYIDDGCYGSLSCNSSSKRNKPRSEAAIPVPLYGNISTRTPKHNKNNSSSVAVWGPTCDGLDQVCKSVPLPNDLQANVDWLVFPNLGCGGAFDGQGGLGLGTAFNGFEPPGTLYCVLGYFAGGGGDGFHWNCDDSGGNEGKKEEE